MHLRIDFVSDIVCPWCLIGLEGLLAARERLRKEMTVDLHCQPFELNPDMPAGGELISEHIKRKYGSTPEQSRAIRDTIRDRAGVFGFTMNFSDDSRIYNTFNAHRLLHVAQGEQQLALKRALFKAYFTDGKDPGDPALLADLAAQSGLEGSAVRQAFHDAATDQAIKATEDAIRQSGIHAVPAVIVENKWLISGAQTPETYEDALTRIAAEVPVTAAH